MATQCPIWLLGQIPSAGALLALPDAATCLIHLCDMQRGRMPIHLAALRGQTDVIALLCDHGCPLSDTDADGTAPLHKALGQGHVEAAQHLLAYGADAKQILQVD